MNNNVTKAGTTIVFLFCIFAISPAFAQPTCSLLFADSRPVSSETLRQTVHKYFQLKTLALKNKSYQLVEKRVMQSIDKYFGSRDLFHANAMGYATGYTFLIFPVDILIQTLRENGARNVFTLHYTNFFEGIGFLGMADHMLNTYFPRHRNLNLVLTMSLFTFANWYLELSPHLPQKDWADFYSGEAGMVFYVILTKSIERIYDLRMKQIETVSSEPAL